MERLKEPSTWAGLAVLASQAGILVKPEWSAMFNFVAMMAGGAAVVRREGAVK